MGTQENNLTLAANAVLYVQRLMTIGAYNKPMDLLRSLGASLLCVEASRAVEISVPKEPGDGNLSLPKIIRSWAAKAEHMGCGNCGEQAALAFEYLKSKGIRPLDYMAFTAPGDHAFVLIGRPQKSNAADYKTWGKLAAICDPWDGKAFLAPEVPVKMHKGAKNTFESYLRLD